MTTKATSSPSSTTAPKMTFPTTTTTPRPPPLQQFTRNTATTVAAAGWGTTVPPPLNCENNPGMWSDWRPTGVCSAECGACGQIQKIRDCLSFQGGKGCPCMYKIIFVFSITYYTIILIL
jgi:hypothetical protein